MSNERMQTALEIGRRFQDFASPIVSEVYSVSIQVYASKVCQKHIGESDKGYEFKNDQRFRETGNLYIQTENKQSPDWPRWFPAGIYSNDNSRVLVIGDYWTIWLFSIPYLRDIERAGNFQRVVTSTSKAILLPISQSYAHWFGHLDVRMHGEKFARSIGMTIVEGNLKETTQP